MRSLVACVTTTSLLLFQASTIAQRESPRESRHNYVPFPASANDLLQAEMDDIGSPLGLTVVTSLTTSRGNAESMALWSNIKGIVHRLHKQNQVVHVNPHYYLDDGYALGCRRLQPNEDTGIEEDVAVVPIPPQCEHSCTNHGRYCAIVDDNDNSNTMTSRGSLLVEETLRRVCFVALYQASDLKFWEYMVAFDDLGCHDSATAEEMTGCVEGALAKVTSINAEALTNCMHLAGGLEDDVVNVRLKQQMDKESKGVHSFAREDIPFVRIGSQRYRGSDDLTTANLFHAICSIFAEERQATPVACDFCNACQDVRQCLWFLNCDGTLFDEAMADAAGAGTIPADSSEGGSKVVPAITSAPTVMITTVIPMTTAPFNTSPQGGDIVRPVAPSQGGIDMDTITIDDEAEAEEKQKVRNEVMALFVGFGLLCLYFPVVKCYKKHQEDRKGNSAEAYFDEMMHASYGDNMAISSRIDDDASDRRFEFEPDDDGYRRSAPPSTSFNVHVVKV